MSRNMQAEFTDTVMTNGFASWWSAYAVPGINVVLDERITASEAVRRFLPWEPMVLPTYFISPSGKQTETGTFAIVRSDNHAVLSPSRSAQYTPFENAKLSELLERGTAGIPHTARSCGALFGGGRVFVSIEIDDLPEVDANGQKLYPYLAIVNGHDGSSGLRAYATTIIPQCSNTIDAGMMTGQSFGSIRHTESIHDRASDLVKAIGSYYGVIGDFADRVSRLIDTTFTNDQFEKLVSTLYPIPDPVRIGDEIANISAITRASNNQEALWREWLGSRVAFPGTAWGAWMAVNTFDHWCRQVRLRGSSSRAETNMLRLYNGKQALRDTKTLETINLITTGA